MWGTRVYLTTALPILTLAGTEREVASWTASPFNSEYALCTGSVKDHASDGAWVRAVRL
jgi:hypothetical protein